MNDKITETKSSEDGRQSLEGQTRNTLSQEARLDRTPALDRNSSKDSGSVKSLPVIEVPADAELDSKSWRRPLEYKKGVPGEYLPSVSTRVAPDQRVAAALDTIKEDDVKTRIRQISGAEDVQIDGKTTRLESRSTFGPGYQQGLEYFKEKFEKDGYKVVMDSYTRSGETYHNLRAIKEGKSKPNEVVMYGAHIDSTAGNQDEAEAKAPGADDDGSGAVALSEIAHAMKDLPLDRTVVFSLFSGEEQGLWGSRAMVEQYKQSKDKIVGMYQMDMIGYAPDSNTVEIHDTSNKPGPHAMTDTLNAKQRDYNLNLKVYAAHNDELNNRSDHYNFLRAGIPAVLISEPYDTAAKENPNYHSVRDTADQVNIPFVVNVSKMAAAAGIELAGLRKAN